MSVLHHFEQLHECRFCQTREESVLRHMAREYHERTEAFDQLHCRARDERGIAIPVGEERAACERNARMVKTELMRRCYDQGIWATDLQDHIRSDARHFEADWRDGHYQSLAREPLRNPSVSRL